MNSREAERAVVHALGAPDPGSRQDRQAPRSPVTPGELGALSAKRIDSPSMVRNCIGDVSGQVVTA
jgi:hypothetical protein